VTVSILIADDSLASRLGIQEALQGGSYDLRLAVDGREAEKALLADPPDLVIADIRMPGKTGYEISALAKSERGDRPVILVVGTFEPYDHKAFESSGADWCLKKPFDPVALRGKVEELLAGSAGSAEPALPVIEEAALPAVEEEKAIEETTSNAVEKELAEAVEADLAFEVAEEAGPSLPDPPEPPVEALEEPAIEAGEPSIGEPFETRASTADAAEAPQIPEAPEVTEIPEAPEVAEAAEAPEARAAGPETESAEGPLELSDEDVDRIARRVIEIAGDGVVREIAWELVPDLAEVIVRERLDKLESELEESS